MDGEGLVVLVPGGCCFKPTDVGTVAKLSLSIATDDLVVVGLCEPLFLLFGGALAFQCHLYTVNVCLTQLAKETCLEHGVVETIWARLANELHSHSEFFEIPVVLLLQDPQPLLSCKSTLELVYPAHEVVL